MIRNIRDFVFIKVFIHSFIWKNPGLCVRALLTLSYREAMLRVSLTRFTYAHSARVHLLVLQLSLLHTYFNRKMVKINFTVNFRWTLGNAFNDKSREFRHLTCLSKTFVHFRTKRSTAFNDGLSSEIQARLCLSFVFYKNVGFINYLPRLLRIG